MKIIVLVIPSIIDWTNEHIKNQIDFKMFPVKEITLEQIITIMWKKEKKNAEILTKILRIPLPKTSMLEAKT